MDDIIEKVKAVNRLEDVIEEVGGVTLQRKHGKYIRSREPDDNLVVNTRDQVYVWNGRGESGDVIDWVMKRNGWDFKGAVEWLCRRARLPDPRWSKEDQAVREVNRAKEMIFGLAQAAMQRWLWEDEEALGYCRGRGWTDETIREAGLGFSGRGSATALSDLRGDFSLHEVDLDCPAATAILGWRGDVKKWGDRQQLDVAGEQPNWVEWGFIPGLLSKTRLVYPHFVNGRVQTFTARNILGAEVNKEGKEVKSYNLPVLLAGERRIFFNHAYSARADECVLVEGQADAVTLGQWGIAGAALAGTSWQDHEGALGELVKRHSSIYMGLDADEAGEKALKGAREDWPLAFVLGPMARVVRWPESRGPKGQAGKDANDWLRWGMGKSDKGLGIGDKGLGIASPTARNDMEGYLERAMELIRDGKARNVASLQRGLRVGYPRAVRLVEELEGRGVIRREEGRLVYLGGEAAATVVGPGVGEGVVGGGEMEGLSEEELRELSTDLLSSDFEHGLHGLRSTNEEMNEQMGEVELSSDYGHGLHGLQSRSLAMTEGGDKLAMTEGEGKLTMTEGEVKRQVERAWELLNRSLTMVEEMAIWTGGFRGAKRDRAQKLTFELIGRMEKRDRAGYRKSLCERLGMGISEFNAILKEAGKETNGESLPIAEVLGGFFNGWLVDFVYDLKEDRALLAFRDPGRKIGTAEHLDIEGVRYVPRNISNFIRDGGVLFPSEIGQLKPTRELVGIVEMFINQHYLLENKFLGKIVAYYVLLTWVYDAFNALPYLRAMGEAGAGKSELMRRVGHLCYRMMSASGANTAASFFRATETYRGTVFIDEADLHDGGDMSNDLVKFLNLGAMKGNPIWRLEEVLNETGAKSYEVATFSTFCPKLIAQRRDFKDDAVGSRSLTIKLSPREPIELKNRGIKLYIDEEFRERARAIRNLLLRWRLEMWAPEIEVTEEHMDLEVSSRLNQVTMPIKALARDDPGLQSEIVTFLRAYNEEMTLTKSMTLGARIVEAMWRIYKSAGLKEKFVFETPKGEAMMIGDVTKTANEIIDEMNMEEREEEEGETKKKKKRDSLTARGVGSLIRNELQLQVGERRGKGFPVYWNGEKMGALAKRYGVDPGKMEVKVVDLRKLTEKTDEKGSGEGKQEEIPF